MVLVASDEMESYFKDLEKQADECYALATTARKSGFDPLDKPEIPRAMDLAERVEAQVGPEGIAVRIRQVSEENDRESTALIIARELANKLKSSEEFFLTNESGSWPSGKNKNFNCISSLTDTNALFIALHAAERPALSPSKQNIISWV